MADRVDELRNDPDALEIEDEFTRLPIEERRRVTDEWLASLRSADPVELPVTGAEMVAEARAEMGW